MISIPLKKTVEVDLSTPILKYINEKYSSDISKSLLDPVSRINSLRNEIIVKINDKDQHTLNLLQEYHDNLHCIQNRVPIDESTQMCEFKWIDAFDTSGFFSKSQLKSQMADLDRVSILFCIAALSSQLAAEIDPSDNDNVKTCVSYYQSAASIFSHIKYIFPKVCQSNPTTDFKQEVLELLTLIMLAQGQEIMYRKSERDEMKSGLIAKICSQNYVFYADALKIFELKSLDGKLPKSWGPILKQKKSYFAAFREYYQGKNCLEKKSYGEAIARFKMASSKMKSAKEIPEYKSYYANFQNEFEKADKDNNFIYQEKIPELSSLPTVPTQAIVTTKEIPYLFGGDNFTDPFRDLVPLAVQYALENANSLMNEIITKEIQRLRVSTEDCNGIVSSLNIGSLVLNSNEELPRSLKEAAAKIRAEGGINSISEIVASLDSSRKRNIEMIKVIQDTLNEEEKADENLRNLYKERWTRRPSSELNCVWKKEISDLLSTLEKTEKTDKSLIEKFEKNRDSFEILSKTENQMIECVKSSAVESKHSGPESVKSNILSVLQEIDTMKSDRKDLEIQLKDTKIPHNLRDEFCKQLKISGTTPNQELARSYINSALEVSRACVDQSINKQDELLAKLEKLTLIYFGEKHKPNENRNPLSNIIPASESFFSLMTDAKQGLKFYADLSAVLLKKQEKIQDYAFARNTEKQELMQDISSQTTKESSQSIPHNVQNAPYPSHFGSMMPQLPGAYMGWPRN